MTRGTPLRKRIACRPLGRAGGHFGTFRICGRLDQGARVIVNIMGRVRVVDSAPSEC